MRRSLHRLLLVSAFALPLLAGSNAFAGEIKFGQEMLDVDDKGTLSSAGKGKVVNELDNVPGEDSWLAYAWAKIDKGAEGPLYVEFFQDLNGEQQLVWRYEEPSYDGGKYVSMEIELQGRLGFNKDRSYDVRVVQVSTKGKDIVLAKSKIKLIKSGREPEPDEDEEDSGDEAEPENDEFDTYGDDEEPPADTPPEAPPPVEPSKKGCTIDSDAYGFNGALALFGLAGGLLARRRRR